VLLIDTGSPLEEKIDLLHFPPVGDANCVQTKALSYRWRELDDQKIRRLAVL
jgi:hypothetical protein